MAAVRAAKLRSGSRQQRNIWLGSYFNPANTIREGFWENPVESSALRDLSYNVEYCMRDYVNVSRHELDIAKAQFDRHGRKLPAHRAGKASTTGNITRKEYKISETERGRLQRAFFRLEIYLQCFPSVSAESATETDVQIHKFFGKLRLWEIQEIRCLYYHFKSRLIEYLDRLENQLVDTAVAAMSYADGRACKQSRCNECRIQHAQEGRGCPFRGPLSMYYGESRTAHVTSLFAVIASKGLASLTRFLDMSDDSRRREFLQRSSYHNSGNQFDHVIFSAAIESPERGIRGNTSSDMEKEYAPSARSKWSKGYEIWDSPYARGKGIGFLTWRIYQRKTLGYIFWDARRLKPANVSAAIEEALDRGVQSHVVDRDNEQCAVARLFHLQISQEVMQYLIRIYGTQMYSPHEEEPKRRQGFTPPGSTSKRPRLEERR